MVVDVQKINKEFEKLQLLDEEFVFEDVLVCFDVRYRCYWKGFFQDVDVVGFGNFGYSVSFLVFRGSRSDELFGDFIRMFLLFLVVFLKVINEFFYFSIFLKILEDIGEEQRI